LVDHPSQIGSISVKKSIIIPGTKLKCGVVGGPEGVDDHGDQTAWFSCQACGNRGVSVYGIMKTGKTTSCGCVKRGNYKDFVGTSVLNMTAKLRRDIFSDLHTTRNAVKVAEKHGISKATVDFVRRSEYTRLECKFNTQIRARIYALVQAGKAAKEFKLTAAEQQAVCVLHCQHKEAAEEAAAVAKSEHQAEWDAMSPAQQAEAKKLRMGLWYEVQGLCQGDASKVVEFSDLLGPSALKQVAWLADVLKVLPDTLHTTFDGFTRKAHEIMTTSGAVNKRNMASAMNARAAGKQLRRRRAKIVSIDKSDETYVPYKPTMSATEIVKTLTIIDGAKIAA
jgi:hypothetical protein